MVGTVKQKIYIRGLPANTGFLVTALNLLSPNPPEEWRATLYDSSETERVAPFYVDPNIEDGFLGLVKMYGAHPFPSNSDGARLEILWELTERQGSLSSDRDTNRAVSTVDHAHPHMQDKPTGLAPTVDPNDPASLTKDSMAGAVADSQPTRSGRLLVETTPWGLVERPDYSSVLYQVGAETPSEIKSSVPDTIIGEPKDALFVIGVNQETQEIAINATHDTDVANTLVGYLLEGIFFVHEKAFGWVIGQFLPF